MTPLIGFPILGPQQHGKVKQMSSQAIKTYKENQEVVHDLPWPEISPPKQMIEITIMVPVDSVDWSSCSYKADSIATDRGDEPVGETDLSLATYDGRFIESFGSYDTDADDYFLANHWAGAK